MKITAPKCREELEAINIKDALEEDYYISNGTISSLEGITEWEERVVFDQIHFQQASFESLHFYQVEFIDCIFEKCDLSNVVMDQALFHRVEFIECKLFGANITDGRLTDVRLVENLANYLNLSFSKLKKVSFTKCILNHADFVDSTFQQVELENCELNEANFTDTSLNGIDLSTSTYENLIVSMEDLKGCTVSMEQAIGFAKSLGVIIKE
ncbi:MULTISPECIES: pentapeptide repeat-containing protein [Psychrobacillus]|uniref:Pentapeptide repeat-containing protein n=1 Tax=Psychrobacillus faecigallinarum TaxID=2762235 RepID=A0ABR8RE67_9BACI|nr:MULTISPECIES: pentapeptide repeat-containing protein [Psychrobacillus]MBD7946063.1 pentapeptide repeat-containing protein [Psychrobacillus faecigallinarum]QEY21837.1 pentapeptide repeat-containing protein [Psychrobacillus sp. AK 1817]QGM32294.1 pentapeptide repeat-containing protein [Bacillus sp. N3536]